MSEESQPYQEPSDRELLPRILIVDDEPLNVEVLSLMLESKGYASDGVSGGL